MSTSSGSSAYFPTATEDTVICSLAMRSDQAGNCPAHLPVGEEDHVLEQGGTLGKNLVGLAQGWKASVPPPG